MNRAVFLTSLEGEIPKPEADERGTIPDRHPLDLNLKPLNPVWRDRISAAC